MNDTRIHSKRELDFTRSQYGADSMKTQNTSSDYSGDYQDHRQAPGSRSDLHNETFKDARQWPNTEAEETFLDDYRAHHGLPAIPHKRSRFEPDDEFEFLRNADYGDYYVERKHDGFFKSMRNSMKRLFGKEQ